MNFAVLSAFAFSDIQVCREFVVLALDETFGVTVLSGHKFVAIYILSRR